MLVPAQYSKTQRREVTTYYVSTRERGALHCSIQQAIDKAEPFSRIVIAAGQYFESITVTQPIELVGEDGDAPEICSRGVCVSVNADVECYFEGLNIMSKAPPPRTIFAKDQHSAVRVLKGKPTFYKCRMTSCYVGGHSYPMIQNCTIAGNIAGCGLIVAEDADGEYVQNSITNHIPYCVLVKSRGSPLFTENTIYQEPKIIAAMLASAPQLPRLGGAVLISPDGAAIDRDKSISPKFVNNRIGDEVTPTSSAITTLAQWYPRLAPRITAALNGGSGTSSMSPLGTSSNGYDGNNKLRGGVGLGPVVPNNTSSGKNNASTGAATPATKRLGAPNNNTSTGNNNVNTTNSSNVSRRRSQLNSGVRSAGGNNTNSSGLNPLLTTGGNDRSFAALADREPAVQNQLIERETLKVDFGCSPMFDNNHITGGHVSLTINSGGAGVYTNNHISHGCVFGVNLHALAAPTLKGNVITVCGTGVLAVATNASISGNTISDCIGAGCVLFTSPKTRCFLSTNSFVANDVGIIAHELSKPLKFAEGTPLGLMLKEQEDMQQLEAQRRKSAVAANTSTSGGADGGGSAEDGSANPSTGLATSEYQQRPPTGGDQPSALEQRPSATAIVGGGGASIGGADAQTTNSPRNSNATSITATPPPPPPDTAIVSSASAVISKGMICLNKCCGALLIGSALSMSVEEVSVGANGPVGIITTLGASPTLVKCSFERGPMGMLVCEGGNPTITGCRFEGHSEAGVSIEDHGRGIVVGCDFRSFTKAGVRIMDAGQPLVAENNFSAQEGVGVDASCGGMGMIRDNHFNTVFRGVVVSLYADPIVTQNKIRSASDVGILVHNEGCGTITTNRVVECSVGIASLTGGEATVRDNHVYQCTKWGMYCGVGSMSLLEKNHVVESSVANLMLEGQDNTSTIIRNRFDRSHGVGVRCCDGAEAIFKKNTIRGDALAGIVSERGDMCSITHNTIESIVGNGIVVEDGGRSTFTYNHIHHCRNNGIYLSAGSAATFAECKIRDNDGSGMCVEQGSGGTVYDCAIYDNRKYGVTFVGAVGGAASAVVVAGTPPAANNTNATNTATIPDAFEGEGNPFTPNENGDGTVGNPNKTTNSSTRNNIIKRLKKGGVVTVPNPTLMGSTSNTTSSGSPAAKKPSYADADKLTVLTRLDIYSNWVAGVCVGYACAGKLKGCTIRNHKAVEMRRAKYGGNGGVGGGQSSSSPLNGRGSYYNLTRAAAASGGGARGGDDPISPPVLLWSRIPTLEGGDVSDKDDPYVLSDGEGGNPDGKGPDGGASPTFVPTAIDGTTVSHGTAVDENGSPIRTTYRSFRVSSFRIPSVAASPAGGVAADRDEDLSPTGGVAAGGGMARGRSWRYGGGGSKATGNGVDDSQRIVSLASQQDWCVGISCVGSHCATVFTDCTIIDNDVGLLAGPEGEGTLEASRLAAHTFSDILLGHVSNFTVNNCDFGPTAAAKQQAAAGTTTTPQVTGPTGTSPSAPSPLLVSIRGGAAPSASAAVTFSASVNPNTAGGGIKQGRSQGISSSSHSASAIASYSATARPHIASLYAPLATFEAIARRRLSPSAVIAVGLSSGSIYNSRIGKCKVAGIIIVDAAAPTISNTFVKGNPIGIVCDTSASFSSSSSPHRPSNRRVSMNTISSLLPTTTVVVGGGTTSHAAQQQIQNVATIVNNTIARNRRANIVLGPSTSAIVEGNTLGGDGESSTTGGGGKTSQRHSSAAAAAATNPASSIRHSASAGPFSFAPPNAAVPYPQQGITSNTKSLTAAPTVTAIMCPSSCGVVLMSPYARLVDNTITANGQDGIVYAVVGVGGSDGGHVGTFAPSRPSRTSRATADEDLPFASTSPSAGIVFVPPSVLQQRSLALTGGKEGPTARSGAAAGGGPTAAVNTNSTNSSNPSSATNDKNANNTSSYVSFLRGNKVFQNGGCGIRFTSRAVGWVSGNEIYTNAEGGVVCEPNANIVLDTNHCHSNERFGVSLARNAHPLIINNKITSNATVNVLLEEDSAGECIGNTILQGVSDGIVVRGGSTTTAIANIVEHHDSGSGIVVGGPAPSFVAQRNTINTNLVGVTSLPSCGARACIDGNIFSANSICGILLEEGSALSVVNNTFSSSSCCVQLRSRAGGMVHGNTFLRSTEAIAIMGILVTTDCQENRFLNNKVGFALRGSDESYTLQNNTFGPHDTAAVVVEGASTSIIRNNRFDGGARGVLVKDMSRPWIRENAFCDTAVGIEVLGASAVIDATLFTRCGAGVLLNGPVVYPNMAILSSSTDGDGYGGSSGGDDDYTSNTGGIMDGTMSSLSLLNRQRSPPPSPPSATAMGGANTTVGVVGGLLSTGRKGILGGGGEAATNAPNPSVTNGRLVVVDCVFFGGVAANGIGVCVKAGGTGARTLNTSDGAPHISASSANPQNALVTRNIFTKFGVEVPKPPQQQQGSGVGMTPPGAPIGLSPPTAPNTQQQNQQQQPTRVAAIVCEVGATPITAEENTVNENVFGIVCRAKCTSLFVKNLVSDNDIGVVCDGDKASPSFSDCAFVGNKTAAMLSTFYAQPVVTRCVFREGAMVTNVNGGNGGGGGGANNTTLSPSLYAPSASNVPAPIHSIDTATMRPSTHGAVVVTTNGGGTFEGCVFRCCSVGFVLDAAKGMSINNCKLVAGGCGIIAKGAPSSSTTVTNTLLQGFEVAVGIANYGMLTCFKESFVQECEYGIVCLEDGQCADITRVTVAKCARYGVVCRGVGRYEVKETLLTDCNVGFYVSNKVPTPTVQRCHDYFLQPSGPQPTTAAHYLITPRNAGVATGGGGTNRIGSPTGQYLQQSSPQFEIFATLPPDTYKVPSEDTIKRSPFAFTRYVCLLERCHVQQCKIGATINSGYAALVANLFHHNDVGLTIGTAVSQEYAVSIVKNASFENSKQGCVIYSFSAQTQLSANGNQFYSPREGALEVTTAVGAESVKQLSGGNETLNNCGYKQQISPVVAPTDAESPLLLDRHRSARCEELSGLLAPLAMTLYGAVAKALRDIIRPPHKGILPCPLATTAQLQQAHRQQQAILTGQQSDMARAPQANIRRQRSTIMTTRSDSITEAGDDAATTPTPQPQPPTSAGPNANPFTYGRLIWHGPSMTSLQGRMMNVPRGRRDVSTVCTPPPQGNASPASTDGKAAVGQHGVLGQQKPITTTTATLSMIPTPPVRKRQTLLGSPSTAPSRKESTASGRGGPSYPAPPSPVPRGGSASSARSVGSDSQTKRAAKPPSASARRPNTRDGGGILPTLDAAVMLSGISLNALTPKGTATGRIISRSGSVSSVSSTGSKKGTKSRKSSGSPRKDLMLPTLPSPRPRGA